MYPFLKDASFCPCFCFVHMMAQFSRILRFSHIYCQIFRIRTHGWRKWRTTALTSTIGSDKFQTFKYAPLDFCDFFVQIFIWYTPLKHECKTSFGEIRPKTCIFVVFVCVPVCVCVYSLSPNIINYACPNFRTTCAMALVFTLQHEFEISTLLPIPCNGHLGGLFSFLFYYNSPKLHSCFFF